MLTNSSRSCGLAARPSRPRLRRCLPAARQPWRPRRRRRVRKGLRRARPVRRVLRVPVRRLQRPGRRLRPAVGPAAQARSRSSRRTRRTARATTRRRRRCSRRRYGFVPWDDAHHPELSQTDGVPDGRWLFINGNNTPRIARIDLTRFETDEILEIPNAAGGHASPFTTPNTQVRRRRRRASACRCRNADVADRRLQGELQGHAVVHQGGRSRARWTSRSRS